MKVTRTFVKIFLSLFLIVILANIIAPFFGLWNIYYLLTLCFFIIFLFFLIYRKKDNGIVKFFKILILMTAILIIVYIIYLNFFADYTFNYFYDIGSEKDSLKPYLSPITRISEADVNESYRNITSQLVYFDVKVPHGSTRIKVQAKMFIPNESYRISIGAKKAEGWSYLTKNFFVQTLEKANINEEITRLNKNLPEIDSIEKIPSNSFVATDKNIPLKIKNQTFEIKNFEIDYNLRESHEFYVYLKDSIYLEVEKRDINWYEGEDILNISLLDLNKNLLGMVIIEDDGIINATKEKGKKQNSSLRVENLTTGVYILQLSGNSDTIITKLKLNTNKIVTKKIFSADSSNYLRENDTSVEFYTKNSGNNLISFNTYHTSYLQNISVGKETLELKNRSTRHFFNLTKGEYKINIPRSNVIIESQGFLTFSKENYFEPFEINILPLPSTEEEFFGLDYIITDYRKSKEERKWKILETSFEMKDLYIKDGKLNFMLNIPHLAENKNETNKDYVKIDWINITIEKDGFFKKIRN